MSLPTVELDQFRHLVIARTPLIDVRAPIEFIAGALPHSVNLPILDDLERKEIGTLYKDQGQEAAVSRGHELVSGPVKLQRIAAWMTFLKNQPEAVITCFRGGMRSQITQNWLLEHGQKVPRISGGYKAFRQFLIDEIQRLSKQPMLVVSGATGSGKTLLIREAFAWWPTVDLELLARHRGSAFGGYPTGQPTQIDFENQLARALILLQEQRKANLDDRALLVEDESRLVGRCAQPPLFFDTLRESTIVYIEESLSSRVQTTFDDYILNSAIGSDLSAEGIQTFERYHQSLKAISKKLGGLRFSEVEKDLLAARQSYEKGQDLELNKIWIEKLLRDYYDPLYFHSLKRRQPAIVFQGSRPEVLEWLRLKSDLSDYKAKAQKGLTPNQP
jgi:tRNA 2-selenouridine synthase